jgi:hypothetical protein
VVTIQREISRLRAHGLSVCRIVPGDKLPAYKGWPTRSLEPNDFGPDDLVGIIGGPLSDGNRPGHALIVIDLDSPDAVGLADHYLPVTSMVDGRPGKPRSHRYYLVPFASIPEWGQSPAKDASPAAVAATGHPGPFKKGFDHRETKKRAIDFIGTGGQAVCPPSPHPSGEVRQWDGGEPGDPAVVRFTDLWDAVGQLASACGAEVPRVYQPHARRAPVYLRRPGEPRPVTRAVSYLTKLPGAVSGQGGHRVAFWAARVLVTGLMLSTETALQLLLEVWNPKCQPAWTEKELRHKVEDAENLPFGKPDGWMLTNNRPDRRPQAEGSRR